MSFEEFEHQARLYVLGAIEEDERAAFEAGRPAGDENTFVSAGSIFRLGRCLEIEINVVGDE